MSIEFVLIYRPHPEVQAANWLYAGDTVCVDSTDKGYVILPKFAIWFSFYKQ